MRANYDRKLLYVDDKIIKKIAKYDKEAFEHLYNETSGAVYGLAMSIVANQSDADDVVQETYISIYNNAASYNGKGKAMAWIFTIARNHAFMKLRDKNKRAHVDLEDVYDIGVDTHIEDEMHQKQLVDTLLDTLKPDERQIVVMHAMSNIKHKEIAKIMDLPLSTVLSKYKRSLEKLRKEVEVHEYEI